MMHKIIKMILIIFITTQIVFAEKNSTAAVTIDLQNVKTQDAIYYIAKFINWNVMISPAVHGSVTLHLKNVTPLDAMDTLLASQNLIRNKIDKAWFIAPRDEWLKRQRDKFKLTEISDETAELITKTWHIRFAKAEDIARFIQDSSNSLLSKRGHVRVDTRTNIVCVQDTSQHLADIQRLIKQLDISVPQIAIEARIASIDYDYERELGIQFGIKEDVSAQSNVQKEHVPKRFSLAIANLPDGSLLDVRLAAIENEGHGELISSPSLFTANQQPAAIEAGEEIPYQETSRNGATSVAFKKAVLSLKVTPQIMPGQRVLLQLQVNQDKPSKRMILGVPAISTRQITTNVIVDNGQTIVLGGIYESNREKGNERIPFFGKIPLIGWLFREENTTESKRELLVFVTPKIV